jgi:hypothetical protein
MPIEHYQLLTYAKAIAGDWELRNQLGQFIAPNVVVGGGKFFYRDYKTGNAFKTVDTRRALGGPSARLAMDIDDIEDTTSENTLEAFIDDQERINNPLTVSQIQRRKVSDLTNTSLNNNLRKVMQLARTSTTAVAGAGAWITHNDTTVDPINEIDTQIKIMLDNTGILPNKLYFDASSWIIFRNHPAVLARIKVGIAIINLDLVPSLFSIPLTPFVGGGAKYAEAGAKDLIVFRSDDAPSTEDASFMKTFVQQEGRFTNVRGYRDENRSSDIYKLIWWQQLRITGQALAFKLSLT